MEFTKEIEKLFNVEAVIAQAQKNTKSVLAYVQPATLRETFADLAEAQVNFARANLSALKSIQTIAQTAAEDFQANFKKATATK